MIFRLPVGLPIYTKCVHFAKVSSNYSMVLVSPGGLHRIGRISMTDMKVRYFHPRSQYSNFVSSDTNIFYEVNLDGLCGSLLVNEDGSLVGQHVAAVSGSDVEFGASRIFKNSTVEKISYYFSIAPEFVVRVKSDPLCPGSAVLMDSKVFVNVPNTSSYVESDISGVFPICRKPADLPKYASKSVMLDSLKEQYSPAKDFDLTHMEFAERAIERIFPDECDVFTEEQIVNGDGVLERIDPATSTGYGISATKRECLDYETGKIMPFFFTFDD